MDSLLWKHKKQKTLKKWRRKPFPRSLYLAGVRSRTIQDKGSVTPRGLISHSYRNWHITRNIPCVCNSPTKEQGHLVQGEGARFSRSGMQPYTFAASGARLGETGPSQPPLLSEVLLLLLEASFSLDALQVTLGKYVRFS